MRTKRGHRAAAVLLVSIAFVAAGACGNQAAKSPLAVVTGAPSETASAKSSKLDLSVTITSPSTPTPVEVTGTGAFDYKSQRGRLSMTVPVGTSKVTAETIVDGTVVYQKLPPEALAQSGGKTWLKIDTAKLGELAGIDTSGLSQQSSNPAQALEFLRGASTDVKDLGKETVRGEKTTHYAFTVDFNKAAANAPAAQKQALEAIAKSYSGQTVNINAWIDGDGRLRKMMYAIDLSKLQIPSSAPMSAPKVSAGSLATTIELYDFGTKVDALPPPADQVTDVSTLLAGMSSTQTAGSGAATKGARP